MLCEGYIIPRGDCNTRRPSWINSKLSMGLPVNRAYHKCVYEYNIKLPKKLGVFKKAVSYTHLDVYKRQM